MAVHARKRVSRGAVARPLATLALVASAFAVFSSAASAESPARADFSPSVAGSAEAAELSAAARTASAVNGVETVTRPDGSEIVAGELIVRFRPSSTGAERSDAIASIDADGSRSMRVPDAEVVELEEGVAVGEAAAELRADPDVLSVQPNGYYQIRAVPNDAYFGDLWGLRNTGQVTWPGPPQEVGTPGMDIDAVPAWGVTKGTEGTRIAIIDSGIHASDEWLDDPWFPVNPDIYPNVNQELSRNFARYFTAPEEPVNPDAWYDDLGHGTHVAGTVAAQGNNSIGITGVNWDADVVAVRVLDLAGGGTDEWIANGVDYAGDIGSKVANMSLGTETPTPVVEDALEAHPSTLYVLAAGNGGADQVGDNIDNLPDYPCEYELPNMLCVSALASNGTLPSWSNYGEDKVELGAPGHDVLSTLPPHVAEDPDDPYGLASGTSMAAPHVTGVAGLAWAKKPSASVAEVKQAILENVKPTPSLNGKTTTGGRVQAEATVQGLTRHSQCFVNNDMYRVFWKDAPNATIDITDIRKSDDRQGFVDFADFWGDVTKLEWWSPNTLNEAFIQSGQWGNPQATLITNAWDYAYWWGAVDQRPDVLATNPFNFLSPRVSFRTNGSGLARDADVCTVYLNKWPTGAGKRTAIVGDSMTVQMSKKLLNQPGWKPIIEPQAKSSFATMKGEIRGLTEGLVDTSAGDKLTVPEVIVMALGTKDADAIAALPTQAARDAALTDFNTNVAQLLFGTYRTQCRVLVTTHETGYKPDGTYSAALKEARQGVNAKLRAFAAGSPTTDIVDWGQMSASHGAHTPVGTRWYEPTDRENPNAAGLTALSNAIISKAQGTCS